MAEVLEHFTHEHKLRRQESEEEYNCDGCLTPGFGPRYSCAPCDYDLHDFCATYGEGTTILLKHIHQHPMKLVQRKQKATRTVERSCTICRDEVELLFFRCAACDFDVHPICAQLPPAIRLDATHGDHPLRIHRTGKHPCMVCKKMCMFWRYRCDACDEEIHVECVPDNKGPAEGAAASSDGANEGAQSSA